MNHQYLPKFCTAFLALALLVSMISIMTGKAMAHPHVFILAKSEMLYDGSGNLTGVRHHWTFDELYSTFAVQGLDSKKDGTYTREDLAELAKTNVESLAEFDYFSFGKASGKKLEFGTPKDYWLEYSAKSLTLHFTLPTKAPTPGRILTFQVYDPTFYVAFTFDSKDPVTLVGANPGCSVTMKTPPKLDASKTLSEDFFNQLNASSDFGSGQANHVLVACP